MTKVNGYSMKCGYSCKLKLNINIVWPQKSLFSVPELVYWKDAYKYGISYKFVHNVPLGGYFKHVMYSHDVVILYITDR